jgi:dTDP-4-amino-4,6-dideoxygalactose transaminase
METQIPLVDLKAQYHSIKGEIDSVIERVLDHAEFILGEEVSSFEKEFARFCGAQEAVGVASGTEALRLALLACGVGPGDEVITTPFTFIATAEAVSHVGARPVFVDVEPRSLNLDPKQVERALTKRTKAILPVHLYGRPADMDPLWDIAHAHKLWLIEDAAQAHGASYKGKRVGTIGHAGCFSFYPGKNLGAYGDAGMLVTNNRDIAERVRLLRDHGRKTKYEHSRVGSNSRLDALQAAILRVKLRKLERWNARRRSLANSYRELLASLGLILPPPDSDSFTSVYHLFVVRVSSRDSVREALANEGIATGIHYPIPLHLQPAYRSLGYRRGDFPVSEQAANSVLSLPLYPELPKASVLRVVRAFTMALHHSISPIAAS